MINLFVEISKYLMILFIAWYTLLNFRYFSKEDIEDKWLICGAQNRCMFLIHILAYAVLYLKTNEDKVLIFYAVQVVFFLVYIFLMRFLYKNISRLLINNTCMLLCTGLIILTRISLDKAIRQFVVIAVSAAVTMIIPFIMDRMWQLSQVTTIYAIIGMVILGSVLMIGKTSYGAQLSINIGGLSFQPSEFVKISFVFFTASSFYRSTEFKTVLVTSIFAAMHVIILVLSKDLGSALIFFVSYIFMLFIATGNWAYLLSGIAGGTGASVLAYKIFSHVRIRVEAWRNPWSDIDNKGYQITQSLFAIGTGGWFGMGLYQGMPYKIPVVEKDFVFAAISEELGGIYALCLILICMGCFIQFMIIANDMQAVFYKMIAFGLGVIYILQVFLTIGGVTKFIPSTGVTLPFVSYGGSSILSTFIIFHILQGLYIIKQEEVYDEKSST